MMVLVPTIDSREVYTGRLKIASTKIKLVIGDGESSAKKI
jgi:hypothetical protein